MSEPTRPQKAVVADKPRRKLLALKIAMLVALVVVVLALLPALLATVYTPSCARCHTAEVSAQHEGTHAKVACLSCHQGSTSARRFAFRQTLMYGMVLKVFPLSTAQAHVANASCVTCHPNTTIGTGATGLVKAQGLQVAHIPCSTGRNCIDCHGGTGHLVKGQVPLAYSMNDCVTCHNANQLDSSDCTGCHVGNSQETMKTSARFSLSTFSTTHGPQWKRLHGAGDISTCTSCHKQSDCARCHGALVPHDAYIVGSHGKVASDPVAEQKCYSCHKDKKFCDDCHGLAMPHPDNFITAHVAETKKVGEATCYNCHDKADCATCHAAHVHPGGAGL
ncbi:MAG: hypothetical protein FWC54_02835 [Actinomycetia bacterium]|nr:hypothetical protein [Actinomycetes bacterium]